MTGRERRRAGRAVPGGGGIAPGGVSAETAAALPLVCLLLLLLLAPAGAAAQQEPTRWSVDLRAAFASPKGDLGDVSDDGQVGGVSVGYRVHPRLALRVETSLQNLERAGRPEFLGGTLGPDIELWQAMLVAHVELTDPRLSRWDVSLHAGAGDSYVDAGPTPVLDPFEEHELTFVGGGSVGYDIGHVLTLFARVDGYGIVADAFGDAPPYMSKEIILNPGAGLRLRF